MRLRYCLSSALTCWTDLRCDTMLLSQSQVKSRRRHNQPGELLFRGQTASSFAHKYHDRTNIMKTLFLVFALALIVCITPSLAAQHELTFLEGKNKSSSGHSPQVSTITDVLSTGDHDSDQTCDFEDWQKVMDVVNDIAPGQQSLRGRRLLLTRTCAQICSGWPTYMCSFLVSCAKTH